MSVPKVKSISTYLYNGLEEVAVSSAEAILTAWSLTSGSADCMESVLARLPGLPRLPGLARLPGLPGAGGWSWSSLMVSWFMTRPRSLLATCRDSMSPGCTLPPTSSKHKHGVNHQHRSRDSLPPLHLSLLMFIINTVTDCDQY